MEKEKNKTEQAQEQFNIIDYGYPKGAKVEVDADVFMAVMGFLRNVEMSETQLGIIERTPVAVAKDKIEWNLHPSPIEFFNQEPQKIISMLGSAAIDLRFQMQIVHHNNIKEGKAVKLDTIGNFETDKDNGLKIV